MERGVSGQDANGSTTFHRKGMQWKPGMMVSTYSESLILRPDQFISMPPGILIFLFPPYLYPMSLSRELLFFFSALGAFNGILCGVYFLFFARSKALSRRLFGGFVLALSVRVGKSVFLYFNPGVASEYLQLGLTACLFIGPLLYFFVLSVNEADGPGIRRKMGIHLVGWTALSLMGGTMYSYRAYPEVWNPGIVYGIYVVWLVYTLAAIRVGRGHFQRLFGRGKSRDGDRVIVFTLLGSLAVLGCYVLVRFTSYISGALTFSLLLYSSWAVLRFVRPEDSFPGAITDPEEKDNPRETDDGKRNELLTEDQAAALTARLEKAMTEERLFVNADLKLTDLARTVGCTTHQLSYLLNNKIGTGFHHYLNGYRIDLARELITTQDHLTLEAIGMACGFNSRSTFYKAFKKSAGTTPAKFRQDQAVNS